MRHLALLILPWVAACTGPAPPPEPPRVVRTLTLEALPHATPLELPGEVKPRIEYRPGFRVGGKIIERLVDTGARVNAGQPLARLDAQDFTLAVRAADSREDAARTALDQARSDFNRFRALHEKGFISAAELERHRSQFAAATAALDSAGSEARFHRNQLDYTTLRADRAGIITRTHAEVGEVVAAGMPVVTLAQQDQQEVEIFVPEDKLSVLHERHDIVISLWALPGRQWSGTVREIAPSADPLTRTYAVRISVKQGGALQPGMSATVRLTPADRPARLRVPLSALMANASGSAVFVFDPRSRTVHRQPVVTGESVGNEVVIDGGLSGGQTVVTAGTSLLQDGQHVRPVTAP